MARPPEAGLSPRRRWLYAVVLGLLGWGMNALWIPNILTGETPRFIFGGVFALVAFVRLGPGPGLLTGALTLTGYFLQMDAVGWATTVYLVEWAFVAWFAGRWRSLVLAVPIFWVLLGGPLDLVLYGWWAEIPSDYVGILWLKQLLNGTLNALVAELLLALPLTARLLPAPPSRARLRPVLFGRFALGFMALAVLSGLLLARTAFDRSVRAADAELVRVRQVAGEAVLDVLSRNAEDLQRLGVQVSVAGPEAGSATLRPAVASFHAVRPQFINVAVVDREGTVRLNLPEVDAAGDSIPRFNVATRDYFLGARADLEPAISSLILGSLGIRSREVEPILILAVPVLGAEGGFDGIVYGALDVDAVGAELQGDLGADAAWTTVLDRGGRVVWTGADGRPPGTDLSPIVAEAPDRGRVFSFEPEVLRTRLDTLEGNVHRASTAPLPLYDVRVMQEQPIYELYAEMRPVALRIGLLLLLAEVLVVLTSWIMARQVAAPLHAIASVTQEVEAGRDPPERAFSGLVEAGVTELSEAGRNLRHMVAAVVQAREVSQAAMERSEDRFRATFEQSATGIALLDERGRVLLINRRYAELLDRAPGDLDGRRLNDFTHPDDREKEREGLAKARGPGGGPVRVELRPRHVPGRWLDVLVSRFEDRSGTPHLLQVAQDVTDRKELEERVLQSSKLESVGRLAAGVAHDLNNMLTPVFGYARMALEEAGPDTPSREWLGQVLRSTERARGLVAQLLAFGRRQTLHLETLDVNEAVREFRDTYGRLLRENIRMALDLEPGLPPVEADRSQLQQILVNLSVNAQDVMEDGGTIHVRTRAASLGEDGAPAIELRVWDTGPGIDQELLPRVFEPFFTTKGHGRGTGLGLPSVHGAIRQMGGEIEAGTAADGGFEVRMVLPAADGSAPVPAAEPAPSGAAGLRRIVVVEDDDAVRSLLARALAKMGVDTDTFASAEDFFDVLPELERPDLLLTDVVLPGADGPAVRDRALERFPGLPTLFTSGYSREVLRGRTQDGDPAVLTKPFTLEELREAVERAVGGRG